MKNHGFDAEFRRSIEEQTLYVSEDGKTFNGCGDMYIEHVDIPEGITAIAPKAFKGLCYHLHSVKLPASLTSIAPQTFEHLTRVELAPGNTVFHQDRDKVLFGDQGRTLLWFPRSDGPEEYTIPSGVTAIGDHAFAECGDLTSLTIPDSVTSIGELAFSQCGLKNLRLPAHITEIKYATFNDCSELENLTIPDGVTEIGEWAFLNCPSLKHLRLPAGVEKIGRDAFKYAGCEQQVRRDYPHLFK